MARRFIVRDTCWICGKKVDLVPDSVLKNKPHYNNVEYVLTRTGYKQYLHTNCWYGMIEAQKRDKRIENWEIVN